MKKTLKTIQKKYGMLNESYVWERTPGKALPTLADVQNNYNAKSVNEQEQAPIYKAMGDMISAQRQVGQMLKFAEKEVLDNSGKGNFDSVAINAFEEVKGLLYKAAAALESVAPGEG